MRIADFPAPDTSAARGALELATQYQSPAITAHALRSWLWAEAFAEVDGITDIDHELLYMSAVLHDIGTVMEFDNHSISYEHAGGHVGVALTAGAGWPAHRRDRVLEVIVRHNWPSVDPALDAEGLTPRGRHRSGYLRREVGCSAGGLSARGSRCPPTWNPRRGVRLLRRRPGSA